MRKLAQASRRLGELLDELLFPRELAAIRFHQARIDEIAGKPVPYTLTPMGEALLSDTAPETAQQ
jgi:hypothetical protein